MQINAEQAMTDITRILKAGLVPMLTSSPGLGKSSIAAQLAKKHNLKLIDERLANADPTDLNGFPVINYDINKSTYVPFDTFPVEGDPLPVDEDGNTMDGWFLLLDELPDACKSVQSASYKIILDKKVGLLSLHSKVVVMAAGNNVSDKAGARPMSTALQSRMVHLELAPNANEWIKWAYLNDIDHRIIAYIGWKPDHLYKFDPDHNDKTFVCPRTLHFLSKLIKDIPKLSQSDIAIMAGTVSEGVAREFYGFCGIYKTLPTIEDILDRPKTVVISEEPSTRYALSGLIADNLSSDNGDPLMQFILRLPIEFQIITLKGAISKEPELLDIPIVEEWISTNSHLLV